METKTKHHNKLPPGFHQEEEPEWVLDLVCGMELQQDKVPYHGVYNQKRYYFCSEGCKTHFDNNPAKYAEQI